MFHQHLWGKGKRQHGEERTDPRGPVTASVLKLRHPSGWSWAGGIGAWPLELCVAQSQAAGCPGKGMWLWHCSFVFVSPPTVIIHIRKISPIPWQHTTYHYVLAMFSVVKILEMYHMWPPSHLSCSAIRHMSLTILGRNASHITLASFLNPIRE